MKHCLDRGTLQAYIDDELAIAARKDVEQHCLTCPACRQRLEEVKANDAFGFAKISAYRSCFATEPSASSDRAARDGLRTGANPLQGKGVVQFMRRYQNVAAAACFIFALTVGITIKPVRAALSNALLIFRVEDVKTIRLSLQDIEAIRTQIESKTPEINLTQFGKVRFQGGEPGSLTRDGAKDIKDFQVAFPELTGDIPDIGTVSPSTLDLTLKTANINSALKSLGGRKFLPEELDGRVFHIRFSRVVTIRYNLGNERQVTLTQFTSPEVEVPGDVNVDEVYDALAELPVFPENLRSQLRGIRDWKSTLYLPVTGNETTEVRINGHKGFINTTNRRGRYHTNMVWLDGGIIHTLHGNIGPAEAMNIAISMK
jgi:hypothetical protein